MIVKRPPVMDQPQVGKLVVELRVLMGLTQEQFAAELSVTLSSISRWERGISRLSPLAMQKVEEMLHKLGDRGEKLLEKYGAK